MRDLIITIAIIFAIVAATFSATVIYVLYTTTLSNDPSSWIKRAVITCMLVASPGFVSLVFSVIALTLKKDDRNE